MFAQEVAALKRRADRRSRSGAARLAQQQRWYQDGRCIDCGWLLEDYELAEGFERCGGCDDGTV